jgi:hypothetical protein
MAREAELIGSSRSATAGDDAEEYSGQSDAPTGKAGFAKTQ